LAFLGIIGNCERSELGEANAAKQRVANLPEGQCHEAADSELPIREIFDNFATKK
jgi:hypothetical protein